VMVNRGGNPSLAIIELEGRRVESEFALIERADKWPVLVLP